MECAVDAIDYLSLWWSYQFKIMDRKLLLARLQDGIKLSEIEKYLEQVHHNISIPSFNRNDVMFISRFHMFESNTVAQTALPKVKTSNFQLQPSRHQKKNQKIT